MAMVDKMRRMMSVETGTINVPDETLRALGLRAIWLHIQLSGPAAATMTPRDREILTLVATRPSITLQGLTDLLRSNGHPRPNSRARVLTLATEGFIDARVDGRYATTRDVDDQVVVDLTAADLRWIADQLAATDHTCEDHTRQDGERA